MVLKKKRKFGEYKRDSGIHKNTLRRQIIHKSLEVLGGNQVIFLFEIPRRTGSNPRPVLERDGNNLIVTVTESNLAQFLGADNAATILQSLNAKGGAPNSEDAVDSRNEKNKKRKASGNTSLKKRQKQATVEEHEYFVEKILDHKKKGGQILYEVKWEGYTDTTWEPEQNLNEQTKNQYWAKHKSC